MNLEPLIQSEVKSEREKQVSYTNIYTEYRNMVLMQLFVGQQWSPRHRTQTYGYGGGGQ